MTPTALTQSLFATTSSVNACSVPAVVGVDDKIKYTSGIMACQGAHQKMIAVVTAAVCVLLLVASVLLKNKLKLPPSPPCLPLLGNLHQLKGIPFITFKELSHKYGPIFTLWFGRRPVIVVNDESLTREALTLRGKELSGRPHRYPGSLYSRDFKGIVLSDDDDALKYRRRLAHQTLRVFGEHGNKLEDLVTAECKALIQRLKEKCTPGEAIDLHDELSVASLNVICALVFGSRYEVDDPEFKQIVKANEWFIEGIQSARIIDGFPLLRFFPIRPIRLIKAFVKVRDMVLEEKLKSHEKSFDESNIRDFTDALIFANRNNGKESNEKADLLSHDQRVIMMGDIFLAGAETTATSLYWGILYLMKWGNVQKKAQMEIDKIIESEKCPTLADKLKLPYVEAITYEILRLSSVAPLGIPHKALENTTIGGYDIPKGIVVLFNYHAINHNEKLWNDPFTFMPERHLSDEGAFVPPSKGFLPFSMGRRSCIGENLAKIELYLFLSHLLKEFTFSADPAADSDVSLDGKIGATWSPLPYKVVLTPREHCKRESNQ